jgi:hypothetical protein
MQRGDARLHGISNGAFCRRHAPSESLVKAPGNFSLVFALLLACGSIECGGESLTSDQPTGSGGSALPSGSTGGGGGASLGGSSGSGGSTSASGSAATGGNSAAAGSGGSSANDASSRGTLDALQPSDGGLGWITPAADAGNRWGIAGDPSCPTQMVSGQQACSAPVGTRCAWPDGAWERRCQCYLSSTGAEPTAKWDCQDVSKLGWDGCPIDYPGNGPCPNLGDVTCFYVVASGEMRACTCNAATVTCTKWGG